MRGPAPLLGAATSLAVPSTSRVPHLAAHILSRQNRILSKTTSPAHFQHTRYFSKSSQQLLRASDVNNSSTASLGSQLAESINESPFNKESEVQVRHRDAQDVIGAGSVGSADTFWEEHETSEEYVAKARTAQQAAREPNSILLRVRALMRDGDSERVRLGLANSDLTRNFVRNASDVDFTEALLLFDAESLLEDYKHVYRHVKPSLTTQPIFRSIRSLEDRFECFRRDLDRIVRLRRSTGHKLNLEVCKVILRTAKVIGDGSLASHVFDSIMPEDGIQPDLDSYNLLMEAWCWNHAYTMSEWQDLRVTRSRLHARRVLNPAPPLRFSGYKVDLKEDDGPETKSGLRVRILTKFRELVAKGLKGDEATFTNVMVAMAREGDIAGVKSILKSVWNIDADLLAAYDEEEIQSPTFYEKNDPLRPSSRLLFTIVHAFAINNQVGSAFILLDYVSRNYDLSIPSNVWFELCLWTRVMGSYRSRAQKSKGEAEGQVNWRVFEKLWQVMTDEPHNVQPDGPLLAHRAANLDRARLLDDSVDLIHHMRSCLELSRERAASSFWEILGAIEKITQNHWEDSLSSEFLTLRRAFLIESQIYERDRQETIVATRNLLKKRTWAGAREELEWTARRLPSLVLEFQDHIPNLLDYDTPTGHLQLAGKAVRTEALKKSKLVAWSNIYETTWFGVLRQILDVDDQRLIRSRVQTMKKGGRVRAALEMGDVKALEAATLEVLS